SGRLSGIARIEGPGVLVKDSDSSFLMRAVTWLKCGGWRFPEHLSSGSRPLVSLTGYPQLVACLLDVMSLSKLELENPERRIWWIHTPPGARGFDTIEPGGDILLKTLDIHGHPLLHPGDFLEMSQGDLVLVFVGPPVNAVTGLGQVTTPLTQTPSGPVVRIRKSRSLERPVTLSDIRHNPGLAQSEVLRNSEQMLIRLSESEYRDFQTIFASPVARADSFEIGDCSAESFLDSQRITEILDCWRHRKNLVLQGPPGVGKSYLARRLAWLLLKERTDSRIKTVQFHPSYSFSDFILGGHSGQGKSGLNNCGPFFELCKLAQHDTAHDYVLIIEEINRGSPEHIFGELIQLLDADKRNPDHALSLSFHEPGEPPFYIPPRVYILGTMNAAEPTRGMTDLSFRRRFSFIQLDPCFDSPKFSSFLTDSGIPPELVQKLCKNVMSLNARILSDAEHLGPGYRIGHSYFLPPQDSMDNWDSWYREVVTTQIRPLLECYWPHDQERINREVGMLLL
ncbi:MAG TPA: AAA family ATPase, partial [Candidatus Ozemobacteraceae bacterium]|nr:AAA family ATPase [Candidatus Ozemobacteraceae bacterium]